MDQLLQPLPWWAAGFLIACIMYILLYMGETFGMSSNLRTICNLMGGRRYSDFFKFNWKDQSWNLAIAAGVMTGGYIAMHYLTNPNLPMDLNPTTVQELGNLGFLNAGQTFEPLELFGNESLQHPKNIAILIIGGFLIGFGSRYAGGCTSGHAITGLSSLQLPSLIAVIGFFVGGLLMVNLLFPYIF